MDAPRVTSAEPEPSSTRTDRPPSPPKRLSLTGAERALHAAFALLLVLVAVGTISVAIGWVLAQRTPRWWHPPNPEDPTLVARAESIERFVSTELSRPRADGAPWRMAIPEEAATAWVNARLPRWLSSRDVDWPLEGRPVMVRFHDERIAVATNVGDASPKGRRIVGAELGLRVDDGRLVASLSGVSVGQLAAPASLAAGSIRRALPEDAAPEARAALDALLAGRPLGEDASWRVDEHRSVRLLDVQFEDDRLVLTLVTESGR